MRERAQAWLHESACVFVFLFFAIPVHPSASLGVCRESPLLFFVAWLDVLRQNRWSLKGRFGSPSGSGCSPDLASLFWLNTEVGDQTALPDTASTLKCTENPDIIWFWCGVAKAKESSQLHTHNLLQRLRGQFENPGWHQIKQRRITFYTLLQSKYRWNVTVSVWIWITGLNFTVTFLWVASLSPFLCRYL